MARAPTPTIQPTEQLQPQAQPVDRYVRPANPAPSPLWDLAKGLSSFDEGLNSWMQKRQQDQAANDAVLGEAAFYKHNRTSYADAVRTGQIGANQSPDFIKAWKGAEGSTMGEQMRTDAITAYQQWSGKDNPDPAAFDTWFSGWTSDYLKSSGDDPEVLKGLLPQLHATMQGLQSQRQGDVADKVYGDGVRAHVAAATRNIENAYVQGIATKTGVGYEQVWQDILKQRETAIASGVRQDDYDKGVVNQIEAAAIQYHDPQILRLLDNKLPGKDFTVREDPLFRDGAAKTEDELFNIAKRLSSEATTAQEKADKARLMQLQSGVMETLATDPKAAIPEEVLKEGTKLDPMFRTTIIEARRKLTEGGASPEAPQDIMQVQQEILAGGGVGAITDALQKGIITSPDTMRTLMAFEKANREMGPKLDQSEAYKSAKQMIHDRTQKELVLDPFGVRGNTDAGESALIDLRNGMYNWMAAHPNANPQQIDDAAARLGKTITDRIVAQPMSDAQYTSPDKNNPYAKPQPGQQQQQQPSGETPAPTAPPPSVKQGLVPGLRPTDMSTPPKAGPAPDINTLSPAQRAPLEEHARKLGVDPQTILERAWHRVDAPAIPAVSAPAPRPAGAVQGSNPILDIIGTAEAPQGYDTVYSGAPSQPPAQLSSMTLGQVMAYQQQLAKEGSVSTAVGRYQFLDTTLKQAASEVGITKDMKFTPDVQDRLAMHLVEKRGLHDYLSGKLSASDFLDSLAQEWAGLPMSSGRSAYDGPLNAATTEAGRVLSAMEAYRTGSGGQANAGSAPGDLPVITQHQVGRVSTGSTAHLNPELMAKFRMVQNAFGSSIPIVSGYRDKITNKLAKGATNSEHLRGNAVDLDVSGMNKAERIRLIQTARANGITGIGVYANSMHFDVGPQRAWGPDKTSATIPKWAVQALGG